jgi:DNA-binding response OmpR family regulator
MDRAHTTALVVDDDVCVRALLSELLLEEGFDVSQASNGFSGLRVASETHPQVILLDLVLPEVSGVDVLRELRQNQVTRDAAIVIVSGNTEVLSARQLAEADAVVAKPFDINALVATVHQVLARARHLASEVAPVAPASAHHDGSRRSRLPGPLRRTRGRPL